MSRKQKPAAVESAVEVGVITPSEPESPAVATCGQCGKELDWCDLAYGGKAREATDDAPAVAPTCKRCHAAAGKQAVNGRFMPMLVSGTQDGKPVQRLVVSSRGSRRKQARQPAPAARPRYLPSVRFAPPREPVSSVR